MIESTCDHPVLWQSHVVTKIETLAAGVHRERLEGE